MRTRPMGPARSIHAESTRIASPRVHKAKPMDIGLRVKPYSPCATMRVLGLNGIGSVPARFYVINPPMFSAIPATKNSAPNVHRTAPCTKLVGTSHSSPRDARMGRTNRSGGAMERPGNLLRAAVRKASA